MSKFYSQYYLDTFCDAYSDAYPRAYARAHAAEYPDSYARAYANGYARTYAFARANRRTKPDPFTEAIYGAVLDSIIGPSYWDSDTIRVALIDNSASEAGQDPEEPGAGAPTD